MRRLAIPPLMYLELMQSQRMYVGAAQILAAAWRKAGYVKRRRLTFPKTTKCAHMVQK